MSKLTCRNGQNSPGLSAPSFPRSSRSRTLRLRRRLMANCTPTSRSEMTGCSTVDTDSDLLEHGTLEPGEHEDPQGEDDHRADGRAPDVLPVQVGREEGGSHEGEDADERVEVIDL